MDVSKRIEFIVNNIEKAEVIADIGTDHGYVPLLVLEKNLADKVIACDINKDPLDKAKLNAILEGADDSKIDFRLGGGLEPLEIGEVNEVVIAGMGGNLIRDILENDMEKVDKIDSFVLLPAQNPEVLRKYLYENQYDIVKEDLCYDDGVYYELFKVKKSNSAPTVLDNIYYEISPMLLREKNPLMKDYLQYKIEHYSKIINFINEDTQSANERKREISEKINFIESMMNYL